MSAKDCGSFMPLSCKDEIVMCRGGQGQKTFAGTHRKRDWYRERLRGGMRTVDGSERATDEQRWLLT